MIVCLSLWLLVCNNILVSLVLLVLVCIMSMLVVLLKLGCFRIGDDIKYWCNIWKVDLVDEF